MTEKGSAFGLGGQASVAIIANRSSGLTNRAELALAAVTAALSRYELYPRVFMAKGRRMAEAIRACRAEAPDVVVVIGGDGTVLATAEAFLGTGTALAIIPQGTVNQLARDLRIPLDPVAAIETLIEGAVRAIDVGTVNGKAFLCTSVIGPLAKLQRYREEARGGLAATLASFLVTGMRAVMLRPTRLAIADGTTTWTEETRGLIVSVNPLAEAPARVPLRERLDGGMLAVYAAREQGMLTLFKLAAAILAGRARGHPSIGYRETRELQVRAKPRRLLILNDGELRRVETPLAFRVLAGALKVVGPAAAGPAA